MLQPAFGAEHIMDGGNSQCEPGTVTFSQRERGCPLFLEIVTHQVRILLSYSLHLDLSS
jgi:hypothetical protein